MSLAGGMLPALLLLQYALFSCQSSEPRDRASSTMTPPDSTAQVSSAKLQYAKGFTIRYEGAYKHITVYNPWHQNEPFYEYILVPKGTPKPQIPRSNVLVVEIPVNSIVTLSTTHLGLLKLLGVENKVTGVSNSHLVYDPGLRKRIEKGEIIEVGDADNINIEQLIAMSPDLIMVSGWNRMSENVLRLREAGIPLVVNVEWMEANPLGRAEWLIFTAAFFDLEEKATRIFRKIAAEYTRLAALAGTVSNKPTVLTGKKYKDTWHMPGGNNYGTRLLQDAGANYYWIDDTTRGSIPLSFEVVLDKQINADYWLHPGAIESLDDLISEDPRYRAFKAFREGKVYNNTARVNRFGGNDYWESGLASPQLILADLIKILHPQLLPDHQLMYYKKLE